MIFLEGNGKLDVLIHKGRIEYEAVAEHLGPLPPEGVSTVCLAIIHLDDRAPYDFGNAVAAAALIKPTITIAAGLLDWKSARRYRSEISALGISADDQVLCRACLFGGNEVQFRKGPARLPLSLKLDIDWPIKKVENWAAICEPLLGGTGELG